MTGLSFTDPTLAISPRIFVALPEVTGQATGARDSLRKFFLKESWFNVKVLTDEPN